MTEQPTDPTTRTPLPTPPHSAATPPPPAPPVTPPPPAWAQAPRRHDGGQLGSILFGLVILGLGLWFFAADTLELDMPDISWRQAWPIVLILIGAWIVLGQVRRRR